jgi:hypothetical protein
LTDVDDDNCVHTFTSQDITKYFVEDNEAINCSEITYGCDVFEGVGVHMCGNASQNIIVVDEGPTNVTETPVDILNDYVIDYSGNFNPADDCCACLGLPFVYSMRLTDINNDGTMDVTFWTTGSELRIFQITDWSNGSYDATAYSGTSDDRYNLGNTLRPVFTKNEGDKKAQAKYTLSTTPQYCNMYDSNTGGTL